ncbi:hypothetical protein Q5P01_006368 [Channa striata]|uniref:Cyclin-dependent kinase inhibitor domain-containing protein n=1 Tax=Channa striata TaxID=64152 RepID=A0AA88N8R7_CHASR|nr:hypothetical protein Q5P01_006368 [Channa striata]
MKPERFMDGLRGLHLTMDKLHPPPSSSLEPIRSLWRRESVCRSLFGPVDHDQLRRDLTLKLKEITEQDSSRWNFDFQADAPLPGRLQWEEVPGSCAAAFYRESSPLRAGDTGTGERP